MLLDVGGLGLAVIEKNGLVDTLVGASCYVSQGVSDGGSTVLSVILVCIAAEGSVLYLEYTTLCQPILAFGYPFIRECDILCSEDQGEISFSNQRQRML